MRLLCKRGSSGLAAIRNGIRLGEVSVCALLLTPRFRRLGRKECPQRQRRGKKKVVVVAVAVAVAVVVVVVVVALVIIVVIIVIIVVVIVVVIIAPL